MRQAMTEMNQREMGQLRGGHDTDKRDWHWPRCGGAIEPVIETDPVYLDSDRLLDGDRNRGDRFRKTDAR